jgi:DNA-directed RNA polymerase subunit RPC12/RpoP
MSQSKKWTVVLRCYRCSGRFTLRHISFEKIEPLYATYPCPLCGARPIAQLPSNERLSREHLLVELNDEMEIVYRRRQQGDTWHFDPGCSQWPSDDYIVLEAAPRMEMLCDECGYKERQKH